MEERPPSTVDDRFEPATPPVVPHETAPEKGPGLPKVDYHPRPAGQGGPLQKGSGFVVQGWVYVVTDQKKRGRLTIKALGPVKEAG